MEQKKSSSRARNEDADARSTGFFPGEERLSLDSFEERPRRRSAPDYTTARSRKRRRKEEQGNGKLLWLSLAVVVGVYLALLAIHTIKTGPIVQPALVVKQQAESDSDSSASSAPLLAFSLPSGKTGSPAVSVSNLIQNVSRAQQLTSEGRKFSRSQRSAAAQSKLQEAVLLAPYMYEALVELAVILQEQKDDESAKTMLLRAVSVDPESTKARMMLAQTFFRLRENENALTTALWLLKSQPYSEEAHQIAADVYTSMDRHEAAIYHWEKITRLNSSNRAAKNNLGLAFLGVGKVTEAISEFEDVIRDDPGNSQALYYLAICFIQKDKPEHAVDVLANAASLLGIQFVKAWTKSPEFDSLRDLPSFQKYFSDDGVAIVDPVEDASAL